MEHIGIACDSRSEVSMGCLLPLLLQRLAVEGLQTHSCHAASDDVKAGCYADNIEIMLGAILQLDTRLIEGVNWIIFDIDQLDTRPIKLFHVSVFQARTLASPGMRWLSGHELLCDLLVVDASSLFLEPEVVDGTVGLLVEEVVLVVAQPIPEPSVTPELLEEGLTLLWSVLEGLPLSEVVKEAAETTLAEVEEFGIPFLGRLLLFGGKLSLAHRHREIGCTLEHFQVAGAGAPGLGNLNAGSASADNGTAFTGYIHLLIWPKGRVMDYSVELFNARPAGNIALGCKSCAQDQILGLAGAAICGLNVPASLVSVELCLGHDAMEGGVALYIEDFVTVVKVVPELLVARIVVRPVVAVDVSLSFCRVAAQRYDSRAPRLRDRKLILRDLAINHGSS